MPCKSLRALDQPAVLRSKSGFVDKGVDLVIIGKITVNEVSDQLGRRDLFLDFEDW